MLAFATDGRGDAKIVERAVPRVGHWDALIRVSMAGICATDLKIIDGGIPVEPGRITGHEVVGVVEEVGSEVEGIWGGQRVFATADTPCGRCFECVGNRNGENCSYGGAINGFRLGNLIDGTHAEYVVVPSADFNLVGIPDNVPDRVAIGLCCVGSVGLGAIERSGLEFGDSVGIVGQGPVGVFATSGARLRGASLIVSIDKREDRLELAQRMGADVVVRADGEDVVRGVADITDGRMLDVAVEAVGSQIALETALRLARPGGVVCTIGNFGVSDRSVSLPLDAQAFMGGIGNKTVMSFSAPGGKERGRRLLEMASRGRLNSAGLVTDVVPLGEMTDAVRMFREQRMGVVKIAVTP